LGYRDREKDIFSALREIFKTKNVKAIRESMTHLDVDPKLEILWVNENLPREYIDFNDLANGYQALAKSDIFLGRTARTQNYSLWAYACDIMNGGVAIAKTHTYPNDKYGFPTWLREKKQIRGTLDVRDFIIAKLSAITHNSNKKSREFLLPHFKFLFQKDINFAIKMKKRLDLSESDIKYLLGEKHLGKLEQIMQESEKDESQIEIKIEETKEVKKEEEKKEVKPEIKQPSLFDF